MSSVGRVVKQVPAQNSFFVNLADIRQFLFVNYGSSVDAPLLSTSATFVGGTGSASSFSSVLTTAGKAFLRDMGHNLVSANRTFRKVQLLAPANGGVSTGGITGNATSAVNGDYLTAYIELPGTQGNVSGNMPTAPVARVG